MIVPVGLAARDWPRAARSLARLHPPPGEVIVVLDGGNDDHAAVAQALDAEIVLLESRRGPAYARNRGAERASGDILLFLDADIEAPTDLIAGVTAVFVERPELTATMGSYDAAPGDPGVISQYRNLLHHFIHQVSRENASTFWSGCGAIRRRDFLAVGGFDERFTTPSIEDIELGMRLVRKGHAIRLEKTLQVTHLKRWRLVEMVSTDLWRRAVPWNQLMLRHQHHVYDLNVRLLDRLSVVLAFLGLGALLAAWRSPLWLGGAALALAAIVAVNAAFFRLLARRKGAVFAIRAVPLYWLYLLVCGLGFVVGLFRHVFEVAAKGSQVTAADRPPE